MSGERGLVTLVDVFVRFVLRPTMVLACLRFARGLRIRRKVFLEQKIRATAPQPIYSPEITHPTRTADSCPENRQNARKNGLFSAATVYFHRRIDRQVFPILPPVADEWLRAKRQFSVNRNQG
jgi:hypothetical protein